jgi:hypothetical protein
VGRSDHFPGHPPGSNFAESQSLQRNHRLFTVGEISKSVFFTGFPQKIAA